VAYTSEIEKLERRWAENPKGRNFAPLADAYRKAGELDRAIELCQAGLARHPDYVSAHIVYGRCLIDTKNDAGAQEVFRKVLGLDAENILALKILGDIAERNGRFDETVEWLTRLLAADPMNGDAAEALARAKSKAAAAKPAAKTTPALVIEPTSLAPDAPRVAAAKTALPPRSPSPEIETFDGSIDINAAAHAAAKAEGLEVQEDVELSAQQFERVEVEGLAHSQYEGSGLFKLDAPPGEAAARPAEATDDTMPEVDLPLFLPDDLPASAPPPPPVPPSLAPSRMQPPRVPAPPPPPSPSPSSVPARAPVPAAVALSDDDGAADTAALSRAEPVLTETMAELYLKQGHSQDALRVYQALLTQRPADGRLRGKVEQLSGRGRKGSGVSAQAFLKGILSGRGVPAPPPTASPASPGPELAASTLEAAFDATGEPPGEPTHAASDHISLDAVFGDDSARPANPAPPLPPDAATPPSGTPAIGEGGGFSFDQFFAPSAPTGEAAPTGAGRIGEGPRTPGQSSGRTQRPPEEEGEADQFQQWLKKLKS
jgi:tetratricopeptide (TPR) repeat protein